MGVNARHIVDAYYEADNKFNADALMKLFSATAVVEDEGVRHEGPEAIRAWWSNAKEKYHHRAEPIEITCIPDKVAVRAKVTGQFPNSPAMLEFLFTIESGRIAGLKVQ